ncbi:hypothetical protein [Streptomyces sp. NPDC090798]|uniref:hypothetical protein n=1 Tax=Streptomyces sp. NPDC090798 TaxID=3365968 RepID=UPI0037F501D7
MRPTNACLLERIAVSGQTGNFTRERDLALAGGVAKDRMCSLAEKADEDSGLRGLERRVLADEDHRQGVRAGDEVGDGVIAVRCR